MNKLRPLNDSRSGSPVTASWASVVVGPSGDLTACRTKCEYYRTCQHHDVGVSPTARHLPVVLSPGANLPALIEQGMVPAHRAAIPAEPQAVAAGE